MRCLPVVGPEATSTFGACLDPAGPALETTTRTDECTATVTVAADLGAVAASGDGPWRLVLHGETEAGSFDVRVPAPRNEVVGRFWSVACAADTENLRGRFSTA